MGTEVRRRTARETRRMLDVSPVRRSEVLRGERGGDCLRPECVISVGTVRQTDERVIDTLI